MFRFCYTDTATTEIYTLSLHDALPILSISSQLPTAIKRRASSTPVFMPLVADQATAAVFMTLTAGATAIRQQTGTTWQDRKSTRLNSSHVAISYAVFCLKKKKKTNNKT